MQTEINYKQLGKRIVDKRSELNIMQKDLANQLGTAVSHLSDVERGVKKPSLELLMKISYLLDTPVDYFLLDSPHACRSFIINEELASTLKNCTPQSLMVINGVAKSMVVYQDNALAREDYFLDNK